MGRDIPASLLYAIRDMITSPRHVTPEDGDRIIEELIGCQVVDPYHPAIQFPQTTVPPDVICMHGYSVREFGCIPNPADISHTERW